MMTRKIALACLGSLTLGVMITACGDDDEATTTTTTTTTTSSAGGSTSSSGGSTSSSGGGGAGGGIPEPPVLGTQIDRQGRAAINTAANRTFRDAATRSAAQDAWNADANPADWATNHLDNVRVSLAILDSLDGNCGNQLAYDLDPVNLPEYQGLATVLTNDWLTVKGDGTTCTGYLSVEADFLGITNTDCGGRRPTDDVIENTYSAVAAGNDIGLTGVDDGITARASATTAQMNFPYLEAKND